MSEPINIESAMTKLNSINKWKPAITLRPFQETVVSKILLKKNVCGIFPTGFGKTFMFIFTPLIMDVVKPCAKKHVAFVVTPLLALIEDHMFVCAGLGIPAIRLSGELTHKQKQGKKKTSYIISKVSDFLSIILKIKDVQ